MSACVSKANTYVLGQVSWHILSTLYKGRKKLYSLKEQDYIVRTFRLLVSIYILQTKVKYMKISVFYLRFIYKFELLIFIHSLTLVFDFCNLASILYSCMCRALR